MRLRLLLGVSLLAFALPTESSLAQAGGRIPLRGVEIPGSWAAFSLPGSNGYTIRFGAFSERLDGRGNAYISVERGKAHATYSTEALVTAIDVRADFGPLGRVEVTVRRSGRTKEVRPRCFPQKFVFEPGMLEGVIEFAGEGGYTDLRATEVPLRLPVGPFCNRGGSYGEVSGPGIPGVRLRGTSFAHDRRLSFQLNKNSQRSKVFFKASLKEREAGVSISREVEGVAPSRSLRFDPRLQWARVALPPPFTGRGALARTEARLFPRWSGNLKLEFPGRQVPLAGPAVHVGASHAHLTFGHDGEVTVGV